MPNGHPGRAPATCHPDRPLHGQGLCKTCYDRELIRTKAPSCHPNRAYFARNLCWKCYYDERPEALERRNERSREYQRNLQATNPEKLRRIRLAGILRVYGMTVDEWEALLPKDGKCPICRREVKLVVDHEHATGFVRGAICRTCNIGIGHLGEDVDILKRAIEYLETARGE